MADKRYFAIKNFEAYQHYKKNFSDGSAPAWIKFYRSLLTNLEFSQLPDVTKGHLLLIWLLASQLNNRVPFNATHVGRLIGANEKVDLDLLLSENWIVLLTDSSSQEKTNPTLGQYSENLKPVLDEGSKSHSNLISSDLISSDLKKEEDSKKDLSESKGGDVNAASMPEVQEDAHKQDALPKVAPLPAAVPIELKPEEPQRRKPETSFPPNFDLTEDRAYSAFTIGIDPSVEFEKFKADAMAKDRRYRNWDAAWRNWLLKAKEFGRAKYPGPREPPATFPTTDPVELARRRCEEGQRAAIRRRDELFKQLEPHLKVGVSA